MAGEAEVSAIIKLGESSLRVLLEILKLLRERRGNAQRAAGSPKKTRKKIRPNLRRER